MIRKTICVIENGLFISWAFRLAREYERVLYFRPWIGTFAHSNDLEIGEGYKQIQRLYTFWDNLEGIDTFFFPDIYFADWQKYLRSIGKNVWGCGDAEDLELYRGETKERMKELGLPVNDWEAVYGIEALRKYLQKHEDVFVKISVVRGVTETFHSKNYDLVKPKVDEVEHKLGGLAAVQEFIVEASIPDAKEIGYDGWCIDGKFPEIAQWGVEVKDCGYCAMVKPYSQIPKECRFVNEKLAPEMKRLGQRGFFSSEIRVGKDKKPYLIDCTERAASPAGEAMQELFGNWGEIIEAGARGEIVKPTTEPKFAAQAIIASDFAEHSWLPIEIPEKIRDNVKLYHSCIVDGVEYVVPTDTDQKEVGSVVGTGNTLDEAIKRCEEYCDQISAYGLKCKTDSLAEAKKELLSV